MPGTFTPAPSPWPMRAPVRASLALPKPSSRHTTLADSRFQRSSQMVPHSLLLSTSTRPSPTLAPPFSRIRGCRGAGVQGTADSAVRHGAEWHGAAQGSAAWQGTGRHNTVQHRGGWP